MNFEFSYITTNPITDAHLLDLVSAFHQRHGQVNVLTTSMDWFEAWQQLMRMAIYKKGPALSEIGAPWTSDFVGMNSLRAFQPNEIEQLGGAQRFAPSAWHNCQSSGGSQVWGIPARVDARVLFYWKDMLEQAHVDPQTAFATPQQFEDTLARLQAAGIDRPLTWTSDSSRNSVYQAATWIWAAGGDVIDAQGQLAFNRPAAQAGLTAYFQLHPYLANPIEHPNEFFAKRGSAITYHNLSVVNSFKTSSDLLWTQAQDDLIGSALPPGPSFVGGTNLVIWQQANHAVAQSALVLISELLQSPQFTDFCLTSGYLPARRDALDALRSQPDERLHVLVRAIETGRTGSSAHLWVLVAERLGAALGGIWNALRQDPRQDVAALVARMTDMAAARLEQSLS